MTLDYVGVALGGTVGYFSFLPVGNALVNNRFDNPIGLLAIGTGFVLFGIAFGSYLGGRVEDYIKHRNEETPKEHRDLLNE